MSLQEDLRFGVSRADAVAPLGLETSNKVLVETRYFDSDGGRLRAAGMGLKIERRQDAFVQTVGPLSRGEAAPTSAVDVRPVPGFAPSVDQLPATVRARLPADWLGRLSPVFAAVAERSARTMRQGESRVSLFLDNGEIRSNGHAAPFSEFGVELVDGAPGDVTATVREAVTAARASLQAETLASRGVRLSAGALPAPVFRRRQPDLAGQTLGPAIRGMLLSGFDQFLDNHAAVVLTEAPEAVHQMRVGFRRLGSVLKAFRQHVSTEAVAADLASLSRVFAMLGHVRECDVFLADTVPDLIGNFGIPAKAIEPARRGVARYRRGCRDRLVAALMAPEFASACVGVAAWIDAGDILAAARPLDRLLPSQSAAELCETIARDSHRRFVRRLRKARLDDAETWHRARKAAKQVRYTTELSGFGPPAERYLQRLSAVQDELGEFNDISTLSALLDTVEAATPARSRAAFHAAANLCRGWATAQQHHILGHLPVRRKQFLAKARFPEAT
jgi:CHAD domain-containing protein